MHGVNGRELGIKGPPPPYPSLLTRGVLCSPSIPKKQKLIPKAEAMSASNFGNPLWTPEMANEENCKIAAEFFATWSLTPDQITANIYRGPGLEVTASYLRILFPGRSSYGELFAQIDDAQGDSTQLNDQLHQNFWTNVVSPPLTYCTAEVCKSLGWSGNSDLAGIGVSTSMHSLSLSLASPVKADSSLIPNRF